DVIEATYIDLPKTQPATSPDRLLHFVAFGLFLTGAAINGYYTFSQGANSISGWLLMLVGILADIATYSLPARAAQLWQRHRLASLTAWFLCLPLVAFAFLNNTGFTSINLSDTARNRASITTPSVDLAQRKADTLTKSREAECNKRGPLCRKLEAD